jgi:HlyD family secretion protein
VLEEQGLRIKPGQPAVLSRWGGDAALAGRVRRVSPRAFTKVSALGVEEQRVDVRISLEDPLAARTGLGIGYALDVTIMLEEVERALVVPKDALIREADAWSVFTVQDGRAKRRAVEIRGQDAEGAEVLVGLEEGERVILHPGERVAEGARLRIHEVTAIPAH